MCRLTLGKEVHRPFYHGATPLFFLIQISYYQIQAGRKNSRALFCKINIGYSLILLHKGNMKEGKGEVE